MQEFYFLGHFFYLLAISLYMLCRLIQSIFLIHSSTHLYTHHHILTQMANYIILCHYIYYLKTRLCKEFHLQEFTYLGHFFNLFSFDLHVSSRFSKYIFFDPPFNYQPIIRCIYRHLHNLFFAIFLSSFHWPSYITPMAMYIHPYHFFSHPFTLLYKHRHIHLLIVQSFILLNNYR